MLTRSRWTQLKQRRGSHWVTPTWRSWCGKLPTWPPYSARWWGCSNRWMKIDALSHKLRAVISQGAVSQKILRLRYTLRTSSSSWKNTTSAIVSQQTIAMTTSSHSQSLVMFENTHNHKIVIFEKRIFAPDICLRLWSLLRFFVKRGPASHCPTDQGIRGSDEESASGRTCFGWKISNWGDRR